MFKNRIVILSVKKVLRTFGILIGKRNPEYKIMKYLLRHFYQNEMLEMTSSRIAERLNLDSIMVTAFMNRLVKSGVLVARDGIFYLNTNFVLNR